MNQLKAWRMVGGSIGLGIILPVWYFLMYRILKRTGAMELDWFLFWVYLPLHFFVSLVGKLTEEAAKP